MASADAFLSAPAQHLQPPRRCEHGSDCNRQAQGAAGDCSTEAADGQGQTQGPVTAAFGRGKAPFPKQSARRKKHRWPSWLWPIVLGAPGNGDKIRAYLEYFFHAVCTHNTLPKTNKCGT